MHTSPSRGSKFQAIPAPPGYAADSTPQRIRRVGQNFFEDLSNTEDLPTLGVSPIAPDVAEVFLWILAPPSS